MDTIKKLLTKFLSIRIIRYGLVGGVGIPVNLVALALFVHLLPASLYPLAVICSFEISTTVNFVLNQLFTYSNQKHLHGWDWVKRALKAQVTSASALVVSILLAIALKSWLHVNLYLANALGILVPFIYSFTITRRFVFKPAPSANAPL